MMTARIDRPSWLVVLLLLATNTLAQTSTSTRSSTRTTDTSTPFWTYTSRYVRSTGFYTNTYTYGYLASSASERTYTTTDLRTIKDGVTPTPTPYSTSRYDGSYYRSYSDLELVYAFYAQGAVAESDLVPDNYYDDDYTSSATTTTSIEFLMPVTWTAPASCTGTSSTSFSVATTITATVPSQVRGQVKPTSTKAGYTSSYSGDVFIIETWYLSASAAPSTKDYYYRNYVAQCSAPPGSGRSSTGSGSRGSDLNSLEMCAWYSGCTNLRTWIIIIATIIPGIFVLGFLESYFWFRRLMIGKSCLRFGTVLWILLSLWVACFTRTQSARSKEDQKLLRENWKKVSMGEALKLWFKWGFRHRYPVPLLGQYSRNTVGIVPEGQSLPQMGQTYDGSSPGTSNATGIVYYNGQPYYVPPQGWAPLNGQTNPIPPPGTAYMPPQHGIPVYYGENYGPAPMTKDASTVEVSPIQQNATPHPVSSPVPAPTAVPHPHSHTTEANVPTSGGLQPGELPTMSGAQPAPPQGPAPQGPPPSQST